MTEKKVLLIGGKGSIGRRYQAVLRALHVPYRIHDLGDELSFEGVTHVLIASPTETHVKYCWLADECNLPFLCEKPLTKNVTEAEELARNTSNGYVVNNWAFLGTNFDLAPIPRRITYDFYNTGRDGLLWDVCQLIYFSKLAKAELFVNTNSHTWDVTWNDDDVAYRAIEQSYLQMVRAFLADRSHALWTLPMGLEMTKLIAELEQQAGGKDLESFDFNPSTNEFHPVPRKNL